MHYVYVIRRKSNELYIGYSDNLERRIKEHRRKYPVALLYYEAYTEESIARDRERKLKYYGSAWRSLKQRIGA